MDIREDIRSTDFRRLGIVAGALICAGAITLAVMFTLRSNHSHITGTVVGATRQYVVFTPDAEHDTDEGDLIAENDKHLSAKRGDLVVVGIRLRNDWMPGDKREERLYVIEVKGR